MKPWQNKQTLYQLYITQRRSITDIAALFTKNGYPCTYQTVQNWLERFDLLKLRGRGRKRVPYQGSVSSPNKPRAGGFYGPSKQKTQQKRRWV